MNPKDVSPGRSPHPPDAGHDAVRDRAEDPDAIAVRAVLAGETAAFATIVERHHRALVRVLTGIVCDRHLAEDVAQEVWWIAYRRLESFGFRARFRTWLHRIAVREALSARTRLRRIFARHEEIADPPSRDSSTADLISGDEVRAALARLPATERAAFALHLEGFAYDEIAATLDRPAGTIATHLHRARSRLAEWIRVPSTPPPAGSGRSAESRARESKPPVRPLPADRDAQ